MYALTVLYALVSLLLGIYSLNNLLLTLLSLTGGQPRQARPRAMEDWPQVTVQLPIFNELHVIERAISAAASLDYPRERLQIQVLDDSTDGTLAIARRLVDQYAAQGVGIELLHRENRSGYKAGALQDALPRATGEFIVVFDADFVPPPDFLQDMLPHFASSRVGCAQARWGHVNRSQSILTEVQALAIDGHFAVEQKARAALGMFLNFNGSAGIWRKSCIEESGGWQPDTLAEDLDLSYRAQLTGWRIVYDQSVVVRAELPPHYDAVKRQQSRWAQGSIQVAMKLVPDLLRSGKACWVKLEGLLHLTGYLVHPLLLAALLLGLPLADRASPRGTFLLQFLLLTVAPSLLYVVAQSEDGRAQWKRLCFVPFLVLLGIGLAWNNTVAVLRGLSGRTLGFERTPKYGMRDRRQARQYGAYHGNVRPHVLGELFWMVVATVMTLVTLRSDIGPRVWWFGLYGLAFGGSVATSVVEAAASAARHVRTSEVQDVRLSSALRLSKTQKMTRAGTQTASGPSAAARR